MFNEHVHYEPCESDSIVSNNRANDPELLFDVTHRPPTAEEDSREHDRLPEAQQIGKQGEVKQQVSDIQFLHFDVSQVHCLRYIAGTFGRNSLQNHYYRIGFKIMTGRYRYQYIDDSLPISRCLGRCTLPNFIVMMPYRVISKKALVPRCSPFFTWKSTLLNSFMVYGVISPSLENNLM